MGDYENNDKMEINSRKPTVREVSSSSEKEKKRLITFFGVGHKKMAGTQNRRKERSEVRIVNYLGPHYLSPGERCTPPPNLGTPASCVRVMLCDPTTNMSGGAQILHISAFPDISSRNSHPEIRHAASSGSARYEPNSACD